jgi:predicted lysophospholipase L1 biosynthesis ABC-type transport system permease subunit
MNLPFTPGPATAIGLAMAAVIATGLVGAVSTWRLLGRPIAPVLRSS